MQHLFTRRSIAERILQAWYGQRGTPLPSMGCRLANVGGTALALALFADTSIAYIRTFVWYFCKTYPSVVSTSIG